MKKSIYMLALVAGLLFVGCKNNEEKKADAIDGVAEATKNLNEVNEEINSAELIKNKEQEWQNYKEEVNKKIKENELRILEIQKAINKPGSTFDEKYKKNIKYLNNLNNTLKNKIASYEINQTDKESFKSEINSDMDGLQKNIKTITIIKNE